MLRTARLKNASHPSARNARAFGRATARKIQRTPFRRWLAAWLRCVQRAVACLSRRFEAVRILPMTTDVIRKRRRTGCFYALASTLASFPSKVSPSTSEWLSWTNQPVPTCVCAGYLFGRGCMRQEDALIDCMSHRALVY